MTAQCPCVGAKLHSIAGGIPLAVSVGLMSAPVLPRLCLKASCGDALARFHVQRSDGALISGAGAFAELWLNTPGLRWVGCMARLTVIQWVLIMRIFLGWRPACSGFCLI